VFFHAVFWAAYSGSGSSSIYQKLPSSEKGYWAASIVSTVHAVLLSILCYSSAQSSGVWEKWDFFLTTPETYLCCAVFCGYLIADLVLALYYNSQWPGWQLNLVHHVVVIVSLMQMMTGYGHCFALAAGMTELTTPFVNNRWFMDKFGMKSSPLFVANGMIMLVSWFFVRVCYFTYVGYRLIGMREQLFTINWFGLFFFILNYLAAFCLQLIWFQKILMGALKVTGLLKSKEKIEKVTD